MTRSLASLLEEWSDLVVAEIHPDEPPVPEVSATGSVLRPGATVTEISAAENRLGLRLPHDYREFLSISNGAYADWGGVVLQRDLFERVGTSVTGAGLLPVEDVAPVMDADGWWTEMWVEGDQFPETEDAADGTEVMDLRPLAGALLISSMAGPFRMVLVPVDDRWEVWDFYKEGATRYLSFRNWLEWTIRRLQPAVADAAGFRHLLERARGGDYEARLDVPKAIDPSLEPEIIAAIGDPGLVGFVLPIVGRWPSDAVVDALDQAIGQHDGEALASFSFNYEVFNQLMSIGTDRAEEVLEARGATPQLEALRRRRDAG